MIVLKQSDYETMLAHGLANRPEEACGLLGGTEEDGVRRVEAVYLIENEDHSNEHFTMSPQSQLKAIQDMRKHGWKPLGNFHTHPASPSRPSEEDKRLALDPNASYMILSLMEENAPVLHSFRIRQGVSEPEELTIAEDAHA
jgi:proteasome lid subunit RPN8/RPN11